MQLFSLQLLMIVSNSSPMWQAPSTIVSGEKKWEGEVVVVVGGGDSCSW